MSALLDLLDDKWQDSAPLRHAGAEDWSKMEEQIENLVRLAIEDFSNYCAVVTTSEVPKAAPVPIRLECWGEIVRLMQLVTTESQTMKLAQSLQYLLYHFRCPLNRLVDPSLDPSILQVIEDARQPKCMNKLFTATSRVLSAIIARHGICQEIISVFNEILTLTPEKHKPLSN